MPDVKQVIKPEVTTKEVAQKKGLSTGAKVGIGIGSGCCLVIIIGFILVLIFGWNVGNIVNRRQNYSNKFTTIGNNISDAINNFNKSMDITIVKYPNFDNNDIKAVDDTQKIVEENYNNLLKLDIPQDYKEVQSLYQEGIKDYLEGLKAYRQFLQSKNMDDFQQVIDLFTKSRDKLNEAKQKNDEKEKN